MFCTEGNDPDNAIIITILHSLRSRSNHRESDRVTFAIAHLYHLSWLACNLKDSSKGSSESYIIRISVPLFPFLFFMKSVILLALFSSNLFADYGVARVIHLTQRTEKQVCAIDIVKFTNGKTKVERICYSK